MQGPTPSAPITRAEDKPGGGWRALGVVLALALAFACAVMLIAMLDIADTPIEPDCDPTAGCTEYFDGSSAQKTVTLILGFPSAVFAGIATLLALFFAATGRQGRLVIQITVAALALGAISILVGSV